MSRPNHYFRLRRSGNVMKSARRCCEKGKERDTGTKKAKRKEKYQIKSKIKKMNKVGKQWVGSAMMIFVCTFVDHGRHQLFFVFVLFFFVDGKCADDCVKGCYIRKRKR